MENTISKERNLRHCKYMNNLKVKLSLSHVYLLQMVWFYYIILYQLSGLMLCYLVGFYGVSFDKSCYPFEWISHFL